MSRSRIHLTLLVAGIALWAPATADAAPFTPHVERAYAAANTYWGGPPAGCTSIDMQIVPEGSLGDHAGEATIPSAGDHIPCFLYLVRNLARPKYTGLLCMIMVHEDGHLHGREHSSTPGSVMFPGVTRLVPFCWHFLAREERRR